MCMQFPAAHWYTGNYLRLDDTIRDLNCCDWELLLVVMRLGTTELKKIWFVFPGLIWGKKGEGVVRSCFLVYVCGVLVDDWANGGCVVVLVSDSGKFTYDEYGFSFTGSWSYSREWVKCNSELRLPRFKTPPVLIGRWIRTPPVLILQWNKTPQCKSLPLKITLKVILSVDSL